ncbi:hypothetical protein JG688_00016321 [Phytophthora aleatoria]|uniref:Uncharacterized protein n=1 Tax=Phytophthora aleatoria TaxID=2496075 RepID=A0A8J5IS49_9STRA|nr:hypothetical protein JG688_00016321 [Phytophthora aleatoria]
MYKASNAFYLTANDAAPYTSSPKTKYIGKVIFLAAVARPRYDSRRKRHFYGKIGKWPIVEQTVALRNSVNRPKGTVVTKCVAVSRDAYSKMLIDRVFPAIRALWPGQRWPHVVDHDPVVAEAGDQGG